MQNLEEGWIMMLEPKTTSNTGNVTNERTVEVEWIELDHNQEGITMEATSVVIQEILAILADTPRQLSSLMAKLDDAHLYTAPGEKNWSAAEILAHLRASADVGTFSIYAMLTEERPILPDINERKWAKVTSYARIPIALSLQTFTFQREELIRVLRVLPLEGWERAALALESEYTVFTQARRMALHEQDHIEQFRQLMK